MAVNVPVYTLTNGVAKGSTVKLPSIGIGCWMGMPGGAERVELMVKMALKNGYRHIDTASGYGNEEHVGKAIRESGIPREEIFVTTKLGWAAHGDVAGGFEASLKALDIGYVDLYLMHWPQGSAADGKFIPPEQSPTFVETWREMVKLLDAGKCKAIGVSNFSIKNLDILLANTEVVPAANQIEVNPCLPQFELVEYCEKRGIHITAYSPLGQPTDSRPTPFFSDDSILQIAKKHGVSVGQVLISWVVERGISTVPKSEKEERVKQNITLIKLDSEDTKVLNEYHKKPGMHKSLLSYHVNGTVFGWTYEQLGWNMHGDGLVKS
ncbi:Aldo/keto reductase [Schizopora paradoxa]|uniref:Aldo/keto reductase n=1 Tax=Schizopora paradoxa TaxID=27342 RepID=A0A0H2RZC7_9AGAM|nr:Aldo/keto reductase [Schizopora paradoxa]